MGKYLVTGISGTGKTTVIEALAKRGFAAYSTDEMPEVSGLQDLKTGEIIEKDGKPIDFMRYGWNWQEAGLKKILNSADTVFIAASMSNQDKFHHLFDKIFFLNVDEVTLRHRLATRTNNDFGKHPDDLAVIFEIRDELERHMVEDEGAIRIDSTQPVEKVVDTILENI